MEHVDNSNSAESAIDFREYFYLIWSWAWLILLAGVVAGAAAYAVAVRMTPIYEASTRLLIIAPSSIAGVDPTALVTAQTVSSTYSEMLLDRTVLQGVIDQLQLDTTPEDLKKDSHGGGGDEHATVGNHGPGSGSAARRRHRQCHGFGLRRPHPRTAIGPLCRQPRGPSQAGSRHGPADRNNNWPDLGDPTADGCGGDPDGGCGDADRSRRDQCSRSRDPDRRGCNHGHSPCFIRRGHAGCLYAISAAGATNSIPRYLFDPRYQL